MRMESNVLATVLTSSVVAGVISSLVAYFQFHKNNKLVYITNERKAWRSDIRRIAEEIEAATGYEDIRKPLVELKVRINAYGKNTDDVKKDSHIWKVIERLQKQNDDFDEAKQLLILYLSSVETWKYLSQLTVSLREHKEKLCQYLKGLENLLPEEDYTSSIKFIEEL